MRKIEIDNVEAMFEKEIDKVGRVSGLKQWNDRKAIVVIPRK